VITDGDLRRHIDNLLTHTAAEVMTRTPKVVPPGMLAGEALAFMSSPAPPATVLFVVEDEKPVGILRVHDLLRAGVV
jgi:arabinose-5-phosphate isomerase